MLWFNFCVGFSFGQSDPQLLLWAVWFNKVFPTEGMGGVTPTSQKFAHSQPTLKNPPLTSWWHPNEPVDANGVWLCFDLISVWVSVLVNQIPNFYSELYDLTRFSLLRGWGESPPPAKNLLIPSPPWKIPSSQ